MRLVAVFAVLLAAAACGETSHAPKIASATRLVEHEVQTSSGGGRIVAWGDAATGRGRVMIYGARGQLLVQRTTRGRSCAIVEVSLDYVTHTRRQQTIPTPMCGARARPAGQQYRELVRRGAYRVIGDEKLGGEHAAHLRMSLRFKRGNETTDVWVDRKSYLPIRERWRSLRGRSWTETRYSWLPATTENLAQLKLVVPAWA